MGLELGSKLGKSMSSILEVNKKLDRKFLWALCVKLRSKSEAFYCLDT